MVSPVKEDDGTNKDVKYTFPGRYNTKSSNVKGFKGPKGQTGKLNALPFIGRIYYLDLKNRKESVNLECTLRAHGAVIAVFFDQRVTHLVSDRSGGSSCRPLNLSPSATSISPAGRYSNSISPAASDRSPLPRSRGAAMLEKVLGATNAKYADPVLLAQQWRIPVLSVANVRLELTCYQQSDRIRQKLSSNPRSSSKAKNHFVKIEHLDGNWKPDLLKVEQWPIFDLDCTVSQVPFQWDVGHGQNPPVKKGFIMTRRPYKHSSNSEEDSCGVKSSLLCNGHGPKRIPSHEDLKVQCNGLSSSRRGAKLLSPSVSDILPLPSERRSTRRASSSWCGSSRELSQLSPPLSPISPSDCELGVTLRPKGTLWLPVALIGTTAEEHGNSIRRRGDSDASSNSFDATKPRKKKLSPEEKLLQDNKEYFKMEVLHSKLRSSDQKLPTHTDSKRVSARSFNSRCCKVKDDSDSVDLYSGSEIMKLNGVKRPKRQRRSELMKLCDEAETFMFGESSRQSVLSAVTCNGSDYDLDEEASCDEEKERRKPRSNNETFLHEFDDFKCETPESRLHGEKSASVPENIATSEPIAFSFQAVPDREPWYDVFQRQDNGKETLFPPISDPSNQLFLLPYELPRPPAFHRSEASDYYAKRRMRLNSIISQSLPRKSPRCHASTLAILSSLKKKKRRSSGAPEQEAHIVMDEMLLGSDTLAEEISPLDPVAVDAEMVTPFRKKKTEERLTMCIASAIPFENQSTEVLDVISSYWTTKKPEELYAGAAGASEGRGPKRRKFRINKTGWVKTRVRRIQPGIVKKKRTNTGIAEENIMRSPRRTGNSPVTPTSPVSPCVVRVRKLSNSYCRKLVIKRKQRRRRASNDYSWGTRRR